MDIRQLLAALTVYQTGNFSEAADQLAFTQSAVSKQINALEDELGIKIFDRGSQKQHVAPTKDGEEIINRIYKMVDSYNDIVNYVESTRTCNKPTVSVGSVNSFGECGDITRSEEHTSELQSLAYLSLHDALPIYHVLALKRIQHFSPGK